MMHTYHIEPKEVKARMDTPTVRAILNMGFSRDSVKMAIENQLSTAGELVLQSLFTS